MVKFIYISATANLPAAVYKLIGGKLVCAYNHTTALQLCPYDYPRGA